MMQKPSQLLQKKPAQHSNPFLLGLSNGGILSFDGLKPSDAAYTSINKSLEISGLNISEVDFLISASTTPDFNNPSLAQSVLGKFQDIQIGGIEIRQSGAGFHFALDLALNFIRSGLHDSIVIVCTEFLARAFKSKNPIEKHSELSAAEEISADAVFSCLVCSQDFLNRKNIKGEKFLVKNCAVFSSEAGSEAFRTEIPSSSRCPERITVKDIEKNLHLPHLNKSLFKEISAEKCGKCIEEYKSAAEGHFISHSPGECGTGQYQGSAGIGNSILELLTAKKLKSGEILFTHSSGAGLNWGVSNLEYSL
jgi:hypothetical protein